MTRSLGRSSRSVSIPSSLYHRFRDPLITAAVIYRQEHIKRVGKERERERGSAAASDSTGRCVDPPGMDIYMYG